MGDKVDKVEEALASLQYKIDNLSGNPPRYEEEFAAIREAVGSKSESPKEKKGW